MTQHVGHVVLGWSPSTVLPFLASDEVFELESDADREHPREDHDENRCNARLPEHGAFAYCACKRGAES